MPVCLFGISGNYYCSFLLSWPYLTVDISISSSLSLPFKILFEPSTEQFKMSSDGDEVAEDYRLALEDLSSNMRFEISNLTVIARENTEHALAIAEVLQQHILKVGC